MGEDKNNILVKIAKMAEENPDAALDFIREIFYKYPEFETDEGIGPVLKFSKARAYQYKGLKPLIEKKLTKIATIETEELRSYFTNKNLDYLEMALSEIKQAEDIDPEFIKTMQNHTDGIASVLERCRPGRVQQILGKTKLNYFGTDRINVIPHLTDEEKLPPDKLRPFLDIPFKFISIVKSALLYYTGVDAKGRKFVSCMLFGKIFDDMKEEETYGDASIGEIDFFDDKTVSYKIEK